MFMNRIESIFVARNTAVAYDFVFNPSISIRETFHLDLPIMPSFRRYCWCLAPLAGWQSHRIPGKNVMYIGYCLHTTSY